MTVKKCESRWYRVSSGVPVSFEIAICRDVTVVWYREWFSAEDSELCKLHGVTAVIILEPSVKCCQRVVAVTKAVQAGEGEPVRSGSGQGQQVVIRATQDCSRD